MKIGDKYTVRKNRETEFGKYADIINIEGHKVTLREIYPDGTYKVDSGQRLHIVKGENLEGVTIAKKCKCGNAYLTTEPHSCDMCTECFVKE